ncbi:glycerophosphodiester phosphodiesterase family protein [Floccifex sp.]|uniref:glycerophosphodiester phosphodiesterase family protein n=1 Tax=Floccifex sp. TaxID=2815810 RepID=UPI003F0154B1
MITLFCLYLFLIKPNHIRQSEKWKQLASFDFAHRGFFNDECPENSLKAFERAIKHGYGIELDVQMTKDGQLVVFHDASLQRMCKIKEEIMHLTYEQLLQYPLKKSQERIPLFINVLQLVNGQVPLIIEIKKEGNPIETVKKTLTLLNSYSGLYVIESFHPGVLCYLKENKPEILRGQLSENHYKNEKLPWLIRFILTNFLTNGFTKPDFIAMDIHCQNFFTYRLMKFLFRFKTVGWTIRCKEEYFSQKQQVDCMIFDSFDPKGENQ